MKKIILIMILLSSMCYSASFKLGLGINFQQIPKNNDFYKNGTSFISGFDYKFNLSDYISFNFETLLYISLGGSRIFEDYQISTRKMPFFGFELPVYFVFKHFDNILPYIGGYLNYDLLSFNEDANIECVSNCKDAIYRDYPSGGLLAGVKFPLNSGFFDVRYKYGMYSVFEYPKVYDHKISAYFCTSY